MAPLRLNVSDRVIRITINIMVGLFFMVVFFTPGYLWNTYCAGPFNPSDPNSRVFPEIPYWVAFVAAVVATKLFG